jgi:MFS family permease
VPSNPPSSSFAGDDSPGPHNRYLAAFMALSVLVGTANGISRVCLPLFAASLHAAAWQIGLVGGLQFAGMLLLSMPLGALIDRHGSRPLFRFGTTAAAAVFLLGMTQVHAPWQLIACVCLLGLSVPFRIVPTQTEFLHLLPSLGPVKAGWNRGSHTLGMFFLGPTLGAFLIVALGFAPTFALVGAGMLLTLLIGARVLQAAPPGRGGDATPLRRRIRQQFALMVERAELRRTMLIDFCGQMSLAYFSVFIVLVGLRLFGMSTQQAAALITLQGALFVGTLFAGGVVLARVGDEGRYMLAFVLLLAHAVLLFAPPSPAWLWAGAACLGLGLGVQHLTSVNRFGALMRELGRGKVGGMSSLAGPAGGLAGATLGGALSQHFGMLAGFRVLAAVYVLQCVLQWQRLAAARRAAA